MSTCVLNNECMTGNCQFCEQQADCVLLLMIRKIEQLQVSLDNLRERLPEEAKF